MTLKTVVYRLRQGLALGLIASFLLNPLVPTLTFAAERSVQLRQASWSSLAASFPARTPPFLKPYGLKPNQIDAFLRVAARTALSPRADLTPLQVRDAVAAYADSLVGRVGGLAPDAATGELAALNTEMRDSPVIWVIASEKQEALVESRRSVAKAVAQREASLGHSIEVVGEVWNDKKEGAVPASAALPADSAEKAGNSGIPIEGKLAKATPRLARADSVLRSVPAPAAAITPTLAAADKKISIESVKRLLRPDPHTELVMLAALYPRLIKMGQDVSLAPLEVLLKDSDGNLRREAARALGPIYAEMIRRGKDVPIGPLELMLKDALLERAAAAGTLGLIYAAMIQQGKDVSITPLEILLKDDWVVRRAAAGALGPIYAEMIRRGKDVSIAPLEVLIKDRDPFVRRDAAAPLGSIYAEMIRQGKDVSIVPLEVLLKDINEFVRQDAAMALGPVYAAMIQRGKDIPIAPLEVSLKDSEWGVRQDAAITLGPIYTAMLQQGKEVSGAPLEVLLKESNWHVRHAAAAALGSIYVAMIRQGKNVSIAPLEALLKNTGQARPAIRALGTIYTAMIQQGKDVSIAPLEVLLNDSSDLDVGKLAAEALGPIYAAMIQQGKRVSIAPLENLLEDSLMDVRQAAAVALGAVYSEMALKNQFFIMPSEQEKYERWRTQNFPYEEALLNRYLAAANGSAFISDLKIQAESLIQEGFDPANAQQSGLSFLGVQARGLGMAQGEFKERLSSLIEFDKKRPGSFKALFSKPRGLPILMVSGHATRLESGNVQVSILDRNRDALLTIEQRILNLDWMEQDFPDSKVFSPRNLYYQLKKKQALDEGRLRPEERFHIDFPAPERMRQELLQEPKSYYRMLFHLARERLGDRSLAPKLITLMRDLILTDALSDPALKRDLKSNNVEARIIAFKNLYEDYKNHLPDSLGIKIHAVKGLVEALGSFSQDVYVELAKTRQVSLKGETDAYRLEPQGFLSVFRGRCGMTDCSFGQEFGMPYTRAMHEDTVYYAVYKGNSKKPKGYVGMLIGETKDKKRVLTIDTINSPSLDGEGILGNLFKELAVLAKQLDCVGIALPQDMGPSFNFDNKETIQGMPIYQKAKSIKVKPVHAASWAYFTKKYGEDEYNSVEDGRFKLLDVGGRP